MNLLMLAPEIQEQILFMPRVMTGEDPVVLRELQATAAEANWKWQSPAMLKPGLNLPSPESVTTSPTATTPALLATPKINCPTMN